MSKVNKFVIGAIVSVVTLGGIVAYASQGEHCGKSRGMGEKKAEFMVKLVSSKLELNDAQKQNLIALKDTIKEQRELQLQNNPREKFITLLSEPILDEGKVLAMMEARTSQLNSAAPIVVTAIANFTNSLTDEQRSEIKNLAGKFGKHHGGLFGGSFGSRHR